MEKYGILKDKGHNLPKLQLLACFGFEYSTDQSLYFHLQMTKKHFQITYRDVHLINL